MDVLSPTYGEERTKTILILLRCLKFEPAGAEKTIAARDAFLRGCRQQRIADLCDILLRCMSETAEAVRSCFAQLLPLQTFMGYLMTLTMATDAVANYLFTLSHFIGNDGFNNMSDFIRADQASGLQKLMLEVLTCLRDFQRQYFPTQGQGTTAVTGSLTPPLGYVNRSINIEAHNQSNWQSTGVELAIDARGGATTGADYLMDHVDAEALQVLLDNCRQTLEHFYLLMTDDNFEGEGIGASWRGAGGISTSSSGWGSRKHTYGHSKLQDGTLGPEAGLEPNAERSSDSEVFDRVVAMLKQTLYEPLSIQSSS